ncbi:MAG: hypothetical protein ACRDR6_29455 [Pseudonocardiaceae bacterium]
MRAVTDSGSEVDPERISPGVENLLVIFETLSGVSRETTLAKFAGVGYGTLKCEVAEITVAKVTEIQERYQSLRADDTALERILASGAKRAASVANQTLAEAMRLTGLR